MTRARLAPMVLALFLIGAIKAEKSRADNVIVTHGGDAISPSLLSGFDQGAHMIELFNSVGFDAMAVGNHEFDFGPAVATERFREATFPILSANAIDADGEVVDGAQAHILIERAGYTFGIFGLTAASTAVKSSPGSVKFLDPVAVAAEQAKALRDKGADVVIALAHTDLGEDAALFRAERAYAPGTKLTRRDIQSELPFGNKTVTLRLTGAEIIAALENGFGRIEDMSGRFPHVSGMRVVYDPSAKPGSRVVSVMVGDAPLDENRTYVLATNDFLARGGDGYDVFVDAPRVIDEIAGRLMAAQVIEYVEAAGTVSPAVEGRLQIK